MLIRLKTKVFPVEAIIQNCYNYLDSFYLYLDINKAGDEVSVYIKSKNNAGKINLNKIKDEFLDDLIFSAIRLQVNRSNQKIREYIVNRALYSAIHPAFSAQEDLRVLSSQNNERLSFKEDPLGIALPWEEKYSKNKKRRDSAAGKQL